MSGLAFASCVQLPVEREITHLRSPFRTATPSQVSYWPISRGACPGKDAMSKSLAWPRPSWSMKSANASPCCCRSTKFRRLGFGRALTSSRTNPNFPNSFNQQSATSSLRFRHLLQSACPRLIHRHHRPIVFALAMRECADQPIAPNIAARQRHADGFAGGEREVGVFETQHRALTRRLIALFSDDLAVDFVGGAGEQAVGHHIEENIWGHIVFANERKALPHRLDSATEHEIVGNLDCRGGHRIGTALEGPPRDRLEQRPTAVEARLGAGQHH